MSVIQTLAVNLVANTGQYSAAMKKSATEATTFQSKLMAAGSSIRTFAGAIAGVSFAALAKSAVMASSDAEETASKFGVVFKSMAESANASAAELDKSYGLSARASKQLLADTGDLLTGFGFSTKAALEMSTEVNKLAVDLASFSNFAGGAKGASEALTKGLLGERESMKALGIVILDTDVKQRVAINSAKGMQFETERQAKAYATLQMATEQSKNAVGDYARTQSSFANQMRELGAAADDVKTQLGDMLKPIVAQGVQFLKFLAESKTALAVLTAGVGIAVGGFVAYKIATFAAAAANIVFTATIPVVGIIALTGALAAAAGGLVLLQRYQESQTEAMTAAKQKQEELTAASTAQEAAVKAQSAAYSELRDIMVKAFNTDLKDAKRDTNSATMTPGQKASYEWQTKVADLLIKEKEAVDRLTDAQKKRLNEEIAARAKIIEQQTNQLELSKKAADATKAVEDARKEFQNFGKKDWEIKAQEARDAGQGDKAKEIEYYGQQLEILKRFESARKTAYEKERDRLKKLADDGKQRWESTLTAAEKYQKEVLDINSLLKNGAIDKITAARSKAAAFFGFRDAQMAQYQPVAALEKGSSAAISAINMSKNDPLQNLNKTAQAQLVAQLDSLNVQRGVFDLLSAGGGLIKIPN